MAVDFKKFDKAFDIDGLKKDIKEAESGNTTFKEVPLGTYEVKIVKLELSESKTEKPMVKAQFRVLEGEYKGSSIFMNQLVDEGFKIDIMNKFLKSLEAFDESEIYFESYSSYNDLLLDIAEEIEKHKLEYLLEYAENKKGYKQYTIEEVYTK